MLQGRNKLTLQQFAQNEAQTKRITIILERELMVA